MNKVVVLLIAPLVWGQLALAQDEDFEGVQAPSRRVVRPEAVEAPPSEAPAPDLPVVKPLPAPTSSAEKAHPLRGKAKAKAKARHAAAVAEPPPVPPSASVGADVESGRPPVDVPAAAPKVGADSFSFDLLPEEKKISPTEQLSLQHRVELRRSMLEWHQGLGIATSVLMAGTVVLGQLSYSDKFGGNGNTGQFEIWHSSVEAVTVLTFAAAGLLAVLAPVPYEKKASGVDTVTVHKYSMLVATIGMATEVPLGIFTVAREGYADQATLAIIHLVIGYITAAALGTGVTALFF